MSSNWKIDLMTSDDLILLSEEEIAERIGKCRSEMGKRLGDIGWRYRWEVELAFAQRELQIRHNRRRAHQDFLNRELSADSLARSQEDCLPEYEGNRVPRFIRERLGWN